MRNIIFVTTNLKKVEEVNALLSQYEVKVEQLAIDYPEGKEDSIEEVCYKAAFELSHKYNRELIVEDTGLFFKAYNNFPGAMPKFVYNSIGFEGIFRLLKGKDRGAYFKSVFGYCKPGFEPRLFSAVVDGRITGMVEDSELYGEFMPYDKIFIPDGMDRVVAKMSLDEKNSVSQRGKLSHELGKFLINN